MCKIWHILYILANNLHTCWSYTHDVNLYPVGVIYNTAWVLSVASKNLAIVTMEFNEHGLKLLKLRGQKNKQKKRSDTFNHAA